MSPIHNQMSPIHYQMSPIQYQMSPIKYPEFVSENNLDNGTLNYFLLKIIHGNVSPHIPIQVNYYGVDTFKSVK